METSADKLKAGVYAVLVHALVIALAFSGMFWWQSGKVVKAAGSPIEAVFVDLGALRPAPARPAPAQPRPARPRPQPPQPPATDQSARDAIEQQRIDRIAQLRAEQEAREQEEQRRKAEQILLEEEQKRREEEQKRREEQQRREREQREAQQQAEREAREAADREAAAQAEREAQQDQAGSGGQDDSLLARYGDAITRKVHDQWRELENTSNIVCTLRIVQVRGGRVLNVSVVNPCNADEAQRRRLENAALNAQPLPFQGFESVFRSDLIITFCHPKELPECNSQ